MYASNSHSYTHLILALGIVRESTVWGFITSKYPGIQDIGLAKGSSAHRLASHRTRILLLRQKRLELPQRVPNLTDTQTAEKNVTKAGGPYNVT